MMQTRDIDNSWNRVISWCAKRILDISAPEYTTTRQNFLTNEKYLERFHETQQWMTTLKSLRVVFYCVCYSVTLPDTREGVTHPDKRVFYVGMFTNDVAAQACLATVKQMFPDSETAHSYIMPCLPCHYLLWSLDFYTYKRFPVSPINNYFFLFVDEQPDLQSISHLWK